MKRRNIPQISTQAWFPNFLETNIREFLTWFVHQIKAAKPFLPVIQKVLQQTGVNRIINIDQQQGAGFETVRPFLDKTLEIHQVSMEQLSTEVLRQEGLYLSVNAFHRLSRRQAEAFLNVLITHNRPIVIVEGNNNSLWQVVGMLVFVPLTILLTAPFVKPFRFSRLIFTYLLPVIPLVTLLDGFIALFKLYDPDDLNELIGSVSGEHYHWETGKLDNGRGGKIMYLLGYPAIRSFSFRMPRTEEVSS